MCSYVAQKKQIQQESKNIYKWPKAKQNMNTSQNITFYEIGAWCGMVWCGVKWDGTWYCVVLEGVTRDGSLFVGRGDMKTVQTS